MQAVQASKSLEFMVWKPDYASFSMEGFEVLVYLDPSWPSTQIAPRQGLQRCMRRLRRLSWSWALPRMKQRLIIGKHDGMLDKAFPVFLYEQKAREICEP